MSAKDQYQVPGWVARFQPGRAPRLMALDPDGGYIRVSDLPMLRAAWEEELIEKATAVERLHHTPRVGGVGGGLTASETGELIRVSDLPLIKQQWEAEQREEVERLKHALSQEESLREGVEAELKKAEKALAEATELAEKAANLGIRRTVQRDEAEAALVEQRERLLGEIIEFNREQCQCDPGDFAHAASSPCFVCHWTDRFKAALQAAQGVGDGD